MTNTLSVQQLVAFHTLNMVNKVINTSKPSYLASRLNIKKSTYGKKQQVISGIRQNLSITRGGFICRGSLLFNSLPEELRKEKNPKKFHEVVRTWVQKNIPAKPT